MQETKKNMKGVVTRREMKISEVRNRKNMQRPEKNKISKRSIKIVDYNSAIIEKSQNEQQEKVVASVSMTEPITLPQADLSNVNERMKMRSQPAAVEQPKKSSREIKEDAIKKAVALAGKVPERKAKEKTRMHFGWGRVVLALSCAAAVVFAIVYFVNLSMPDLSLRVAAMQTGIEASYPSYVPRDFNLSDITSEDGKIVMNFRNNSSGDTFSLTEEKSSWDSTALLENFVKSEYGEDYTIVRENGLTLYVSGSSAAWVNGGTVYKLDADSGVLTKKQIRTIAVSL